MKRQFVPSEEWRDAHQGPWKDFQRTDGAVPCSLCAKPLYDHPQPLKKSCPTMVEDCFKRWWKL